MGLRVQDFGVEDLGFRVHVFRSLGLIGVRMQGLGFGISGVLLGGQPVLVLRAASWSWWGALKTLDSTMEAVIVQVLEGTKF